MSTALPTHVHVWWQCNDPGNVAKVVRAVPYQGRYPQFFTHVLTLEAPNTHKGTLEMAWDNRRINPDRA